MSNTLNGKVALVTGASRGIGAAIARRLAAEGADVAISYAASADQAQAVVQALEAQGVRAAAFQADQAEPVAVAGLVEAVLARFGRLDILVNSAGVAVAAPFDQLPDVAALDRQFRINVGGVAAAVRAAAPHLPAGGRIISIGSAVANRMPFPGMADYTASKAAVAGFTRAWARELGPRGITVNVVQPGPVATEMNREDGPMAEAMRGATVLGRYARPEEVAAAVAFLAGPEAGFITGAALDVDGGFSL